MTPEEFKKVRTAVFAALAVGGGVGGLITNFFYLLVVLGSCK